VVIAGGGDTAVDWALSLSEIAARVSVVHRRDKFRAAPESEAKLRRWPRRAGRHGGAVSASGLDGANGQLKSVTVGHARWRGEEDRG